MDYKETYIGLFSGSFSDLDYLDFSGLNLKFVSLDSEEFLEFNKTFEDTDSIYSNAIDEFTNDYNKSSIEKLHVLLPIDCSLIVDELSIWKVRDILLLIFPSNFSMEVLFGFRVYNNDLEFFLYDKFKPISITCDYRSSKEFVYFEESQSAKINKFIGLFLSRFDDIKYLIPAFDSYISSFGQSFKKMEYLSLCIALETIVESTSELNFRIKRNVAVLLSTNKEFGWRIFNNIALVYNLRSKLVHSGSYKSIKIEEYLPYLRAIVCLIIIELIKLNIQNLAQLNQLLTEKGFGDLYNESEEFFDFEVNHSLVTRVIVTELKK